MTKKAFITWISVVSGLLTILLVFENPFKDKAELHAYVESQELLNVVKLVDEVFDYNTQYALKMTLKNTGELVAKDVHIKVKDVSGFAVLKKDRRYEKIDDSSSIYIDRLEAGTELELYFWGSFFSISHYHIDDNFSISSPDSGKAILRSDIRGDNIIWHVDKHFIWIVTVLFFLSLIILVFTAHHLEKKHESNEEKPDIHEIENSHFRADMDKISYAWSIGLITEDEFISRGKSILESSLNIK